MNANANINESKKKGRPVYLDSQATTPMDPRVVEAMAPFFGDKFGNPHSRNHFYGWETEEAVEKARRQIADLIGGEASELIFTSGVTASNNLGIQESARFHKENKHHIVTVATEHKCVLEACAASTRAEARQRLDEKKSKQKDRQNMVASIDTVQQVKELTEEKYK